MFKIESPNALQLLMLDVAGRAKTEDARKALRQAADKLEPVLYQINLGFFDAKVHQIWDDVFKTAKQCYRALPAGDALVIRWWKEVLLWEATLLANLVYQGQEYRHLVRREPQRFEDCHGLSIWYMATGVIEDRINFLEEQLGISEDTSPEHFDPAGILEEFTVSITIPFASACGMLNAAA